MGKTSRQVPVAPVCAVLFQFRRVWLPVGVAVSKRLMSPSDAVVAAAEIQVERSARGLRSARQSLPRIRGLDPAVQRPSKDVHSDIAYRLYRHTRAMTCAEAHDTSRSPRL